MKFFISMLLFAMFSLFGVSAFAVPVDLTTLISAVDLSTAIEAIFIVAASLACVYFAWNTAKMILAEIRGDDY